MLWAFPLLIKVEKNPAGYNLPPLPKFFALFSTEKISALLVCEEKKLLPLRSLPAPIPPTPPAQKSNGSPLKYLQIAVN